MPAMLTEDQIFAEPDELYREVWDAAAARLDGHALAEAAGLGQQLLDYQDTNSEEDRDY